MYENIREPPPPHTHTHTHTPPGLGRLLPVGSTIPVDSITMVNRNYSSRRVLVHPKRRTYRIESLQIKERMRKKTGKLQIKSRKQYFTSIVPKIFH